ncbi:MAG: hypothetical protein OXD45_12710 [Rhodobacteraceae bacterium]|nr:hypothetical protein [Paracoccaceae bacterium]
MIVSEEFSPWEDSKNRIDLLGIDSEANLVVIELKRTKDGRHMDLQAVRYAAMVSAMTLDELVGYFQNFLSDNSNASEILGEHLGHEDLASIELGQNVKIVLVSPGFSKELTTTVLWLNEQSDLDIRCVRMRPHNNYGKILLDVQTIIPLRETNQYQTQLRNRRKAEREKYPKYNVSFGGELYPDLSKGRSMHLIFSKLFENDENLENIMKIIRGKIQVFDGLLEDEEVRNELKSKDKGAKSSPNQTILL